MPHAYLAAMMMMMMMMMVVIIIIITRRRGKPQRDGRAPFYSQTFVAMCENFVTMATAVGCSPV